METSRKRIHITYDSELKEIRTTWQDNMLITNDDECKFQQPSFKVLEGDLLELKATKECLEKMLKLVDEAMNGN